MLRFIGLFISLSLKVLENASLDLRSAFPVGKETPSHRAQMVSYISDTGQLQEFPKVQGRLGLVLLSLEVWFGQGAYVFVTLQGEAFHMQVTGDNFLEWIFGVFNVIAKDYRGTFKQSSCPQPDQGFFSVYADVSFSSPTVATNCGMEQFA